MAQIFWVHCPACKERFPVHTELWQSAYDLLCPFCQTSFPQSESPSIISPNGEQSHPAPVDPAATAESM